MKKESKEGKKEYKEEKHYPHSKTLFNGILSQQESGHWNENKEITLIK